MNRGLWIADCGLWITDWTLQNRRGARLCALGVRQRQLLPCPAFSPERPSALPPGESQGEGARPAIPHSAFPIPHLDSPLPDASAPGAVPEPVIENHTLPEPMPAETPTPDKNPNVILLQRDKECKGSVRFATPDDTAAITNAYVSRSLPGVNSARQIRITIEVLP